MLKLDIHSQERKMDIKLQRPRAGWNLHTLYVCIQGWTKTHVNSCGLCLGDLGTEINTNTWPKSQGHSGGWGKAEQLRVQLLLLTEEAAQHISHHVCELQNDCCFPPVLASSGSL